jgi:hypothetical protein
MKKLTIGGELDPDKILEVPPMLVVVTTKEWQKEAAAMTVQNKKELFYRSLFGRTHNLGRRRKLIPEQTE